jgi:hypothetical protein
MDWTKIDWFAFFPSLFSIYLVSISTLFKNYLVKQVEHATDRLPQIRPHQEFIQNLALGWEALVDSVNAVIASFFSAIAIWAASKSFTGASVTFIILLGIFTPMLWFGFAHEPDEIVCQKHPRLRITPDAIFKIIIVVINLVLIIAIAWSQQVNSPTQIPTSKPSTTAPTP